MLEPYQNINTQALLATTVAGETIETTPGHPFWVVRGEELAYRPWPEHAGPPNASGVVEGRWVKAGDVRVGDVLLLRDGRQVPIEKIEVRPGGQAVYNFRVEGLDSYAVGLASLLVHNMSEGESQPGPYDVGLAKDLRRNPVPDTEVHHTPQSRRADTLVGDFNERNKVGNEPAIRLPKDEHDAVNAAQNSRPRAPASARELLHDEIQILRKNTKAPNSKLLDLIRLNKKLHPWDYRKTCTG